MNIVIGASPAERLKGTKVTRFSGKSIQAELLDVRTPRKRRGLPPAGQRDRRKKPHLKATEKGNVVVLQIPEDANVPGDIDSDNYKVIIRFVPNKPSR